MPRKPKAAVPAVALDEPVIVHATHEDVAVSIDDPVVQAALAAAVDELDVVFEASGRKSSEGDGVTAADIEAAQAASAIDDDAPTEAGPEYAGPELFFLADGEEITGQRDLEDGDVIVVTSYGRKARLGGRSDQPYGAGDFLIEKMAGFPSDRDQPAPQPGTPEHAAAYGDA